jgi:hypothetical protein
MPQHPQNPQNPETPSQISGINVNELRSQIVQTVLAQMLRLGVQPERMRAGYVQSEGKNYGSYARD